MRTRGKSIPRAALIGPSFGARFKSPPRLTCPGAMTDARETVEGRALSRGREAPNISQRRTKTERLIDCFSHFSPQKIIEPSVAATHREREGEWENSPRRLNGRTRTATFIFSVAMAPRFSHSESRGWPVPRHGHCSTVQSARLTHIAILPPRGIPRNRHSRTGEETRSRKIALF